jgi:hypothetical protein
MDNSNYVILVFFGGQGGDGPKISFVMKEKIKINIAQIIFNHPWMTHITSSHPWTMEIISNLLKN